MAFGWPGAAAGQGYFVSIQSVSITPWQDQEPGTSGLRKSTRDFMRPGYLEAFLQSVFDEAAPQPGDALLVGGDGRFFCREAAAIVVRMALANGFSRVIVGRDGLMSTPAASHLIRKRGAKGGVILSASHNPGGPDGDFGVKYNTDSGGPAPTTFTAGVFARSKALTAYRILQDEAPDLSVVGETRLGDGVVEVVDPIADYAGLMETVFDFDAIRALVSQPGFRMAFDAMNAVTGPYATEILERRLGAPAGTVLRGEPLPDFGGGHPDPHPDHTPELTARMFGEDPLDFAAASDGDGDRNMIMGPAMVVSPGDSLAILAAHADCVPRYRDGLKGLARSMPTSRAADRVAAALGIEMHETPTGWKFFTNLLDAGRITLCGEESFGTGSDHVREKDGLWAVLFWLNVLAATGKGVGEVVVGHWSRFGRDYYQRHDYEGLEVGPAQDFMKGLREAAAGAEGRQIAGYLVQSAEDFAYSDPVDGSEVKHQGVTVRLSPDARVTYRLSGTGSSGATLRVYLERFEDPAGDLHRDPAEALAAVAEVSRAFAGIEARLGRTEPSVIT